MSILCWLNALGGRGAASDLEDRQTIRPVLESLEDRLTPTTPLGAFTNATVQIIPNLTNFTVTEKVTANVSFPFVEGAGTPPSAPVQFNLNNQMQSVNLDSNGQATATFTFPLFVLLTSQTLQVSYPPRYVGTPPYLANTGSLFQAPLYTNFDNLFLPATLTFGVLTGQQLLDHETAAGDVFVPSFNTVAGETDDMGLLRFDYSDPGIITGLHILGFALPGSLAFAVGAYGTEFMPNGGSW